MSLEYIVNDAVLNVWCNPEQDLQAIVKPARITRMVGVWGQFDAGKNTYRLPNDVDRFHVFHVGQLNPVLLGLLKTDDWWARVADTCNKKNLVVDVYDANGIQFPRTETWYMVTPTKNLLFAIKEQPTIPVDLRVADIFLRFYTNAYYQSLRSDGLNDSIQVVGQRVTTTDEILEIQSYYDAAKQRPGHAYAFVNGYKIANLNLFTVKPGDYVEYVHDTSILKVIDFPLHELEAFDSTKDNKHKFLLHYPGWGSGTIDYHDDADFFLVKKGRRGGHKGVYYHRNAESGDAVRMVTHKDYAIPTDYVDAYLAKQGWKLDEVILRVHIRQSGYHRPLINEANRVKELYKMSDADVVGAMLSVDALVPVWTAPALEASGYTGIMASRSANMPPALVQEGYGYNAISKLLADTPKFVKTSSNQQVVDVPFGLQVRSIAYEHDAAGKLLGYYQHLQGAVYVCRNKNAVLVEMVAGTISTQLDEVYANVDVTIDPKADYRYYMCGIEINGEPNNKWVDVTGTDKYTVFGNSVHWNVNPDHYYTVVRGNKNVLAYTLALSNERGVLRFSLTHQAYRNGMLRNQVMEIPMGELDLYLNDRPLIEELDYYVNFPEVVIVNKKYLKTGNDQKVDVRFTGFCKSDLSREFFADKGFVSHGLLSPNNRFDLRDDKVQRIIVDGALYDKSELRFAENDIGVRVPDVKNGAPYAIRDHVIPLRGLTNADTYALRSKAQLVDKQVSDYMTSKLPQQVFDTPNTILELFPVVSPFCSKILYELKYGNLKDDRLKGAYSDILVFELCQPYEYLLAFDPTQDDLRPDPDYVAIHPHHYSTVVEIDLYCYKFLTRAVKLYLKDRVNLSHFIRLSA